MHRFTMSTNARSIAFGAMIAGGYAICAAVASWIFWFPVALAAFATPLLYITVTALTGKSGNGLLSALSAGLTYGLVSSIGQWIVGFNDLDGILTSLLLHPTIAAICGGLTVSVRARVNNRPGIIWTTVAIGVICEFSAGLFIWLYMVLFHKPFDDHRFDRGIWLRDSGAMNPRSLRGNMVGDLERRIILPGMSRSEVLVLLGAPDVGMDTDRYEYAIGSWTGLGFDDDSFDVTFDAQGHVAETTVHQH